MVAALHTKISDVTHTPLIGSDPWKYVGPTNWHVKSPTNSLMAIPSISANALPIDFFVDVFVGMKANNQTVALLVPLCQVGNKVLPEFSSWACEIALLGDKISVVLLIRCAAIRIFVVAGVVAAHDPCLNSFTFQRHH
jgi:hypothetical protein